MAYLQYQIPSITLSTPSLPGIFVQAQYLVHFHFDTVYDFVNLWPSVKQLGRDTELYAYAARLRVRQ